MTTTAQRSAKLRTLPLWRVNGRNARGGFATATVRAENIEDAKARAKSYGIHEWTAARLMEAGVTP